MLVIPSVIVELDPYPVLQLCVSIVGLMHIEDTAYKTVELMEHLQNAHVALAFMAICVDSSCSISRQFFGRLVINPNQARAN